MVRNSVENNFLFTYNPDNFKTEGIDNEFIENGIYIVNAFEVYKRASYRENLNYDAHDIEKYNTQKEVLKILNDMLET